MYTSGALSSVPRHLYGTAMFVITGYYTHFLLTMLEPVSSYSLREIQSWWKVPNEAIIDPPNQLPHLRSTVFPGACNLTLYY